jgi:hypothetical protein
VRTPSGCASRASAFERFRGSARRWSRRPAGLWFNDQPDFEGIGAWLLDVYLSARIEGASEEEARQRVIDQIQQTEEWRQGHPGQ